MDSRRKKRTSFDKAAESASLRLQANSPAMKSETVGTQPAKSRTSVTKSVTDGATIAIKKILAPTDFSPASQKALRYALRFARDCRFGAHVASRPRAGGLAGFRGIQQQCRHFPRAEIADAEESLRTLIKSVRGAGVARARSTIRTGVATHEIVEAAKELDVDLVVIATHGYTGWKHFAIGSTAARVARAAPCPVLVVREKEHDFL